MARATCSSLADSLSLAALSIIAPQPLLNRVVLALKFLATDRFACLGLTIGCKWRLKLRQLLFNPKFHQLLRHRNSP